MVNGRLRESISETRFRPLQVFAAHAKGLHAMLDGLDRVWLLNGEVFFFPCLDKRRQHIQPVSLRRLGLRVHQPLDLGKRGLVVRFGSVQPSQIPTTVLQSAPSTHRHKCSARNER